MKKILVMWMLFALVVIGWYSAAQYQWEKAGIEHLRYRGNEYIIRTYTGDTINAHRLQPVNVKAFGVEGDGVTDDTDSLNACIDWINSIGGGALYLPAGTYLLESPSLSDSADDGVGEGSFLHWKDGVSLIGDGRSSILKVADDAGDYHAVIRQFNDEDTLQSILFRDFVIDQNSDNNAVRSVNSISRTDSANFRCGLFMTRANGVVVDNVLFQNPSGINTLIMNGAKLYDDAQIMENVIIKNCRFWAVGGEDTTNYDHSTIYIAGSHVLIDGCKFMGEGRYGPGAYGTRCAIETHSSYTTVVNNDVRFYQRFANVCGLNMFGNENVFYANNTARDVGSGMLLYHHNYKKYPDRTYGADNWMICDNTFHIIQCDSAYEYAYRGGIVFGPLQIADYEVLPVRNVTIANNTITWEPHSSASVGMLYTSYGLGITHTPAQYDSCTHYGLTFADNKLINPPYTGMLMAYCTYNDLTIDGNIFVNPCDGHAEMTAPLKDGMFLFPYQMNGARVTNNYVKAQSESMFVSYYLGNHVDTLSNCTGFIFDNNINVGNPKYTWPDTTAHWPLFIGSGPIADKLTANGSFIELDAAKMGAGTTPTDSFVILSLLVAAQYLNGGEIHFPKLYRDYICGSEFTLTDTNVVLTGAGIPDSIKGGAPRLLHGYATPEASAYGNIGSIYQRHDAGGDSSLYMKISGTAATGWVPIQYSGLDPDSIIFDPMSQPATPTEGTLYFDSTSKALTVFDGTAWDTLATLGDL